MPPHFETLAYGASPDQVGDLYLPAPDPGPAAKSPVICLLHGGFWRMPYGRDHIAPLAGPLLELGFAVWNVEYRRVGAAGGGWPGTLADVAAGVDHLATLAATEGAALDLSRVTVLGHSAGGHLALWCAARGRAHAGELGARPRVHPVAAVGLAAVSDLVWAHAQDCGRGAVGHLVGGSPVELPLRYRCASPFERLPLGVPQLLIHGTPDEDVPVEISRRYARAAAAAGDALTFIELPTATHMDCVDPDGEVTRLLLAWLRPRRNDATA